MGKFAIGKNAFAISDRSGFRYRYKDMREEWNGLLVGRDEFEAKQPQLGPFRKATDPQALKNARPDKKEVLDVYVGIPLVEAPQPRPTRAFGVVGVVTLDIADTGPTAFVRGVSGTGSVGSVTISSSSSTALRFDSTSVKLDSTTKTFDEG